MKFLNVLIENVLVITAVELKNSNGGTRTLSRGESSWGNLHQSFTLA